MIKPDIPDTAWKPVSELPEHHQQLILDERIEFLNAIKSGVFGKVPDALIAACDEQYEYIDKVIMRGWKSDDNLVPIPPDSSAEITPIHQKE